MIITTCLNNFALNIFSYSERDVWSCIVCVFNVLIIYATFCILAVSSQ